MLPCAVSPLIPYAMSSMYPSASSVALGISSSSALYIMNRIGDSGDPCGMPASMLILADVIPLNLSCVEGRENECGHVCAQVHRNHTSSGQQRRAVQVSSECLDSGRFVR